MNRSTALNILHLEEDAHDRETISDAAEAVLFDLAGFFLRQLPHPKLVEARIKKLQALEEALAVFSITGQGTLKLAEPELNGEPLEIIRSYEEQMAAYRTSLANTVNIPDAVEILKKMSALQELWDQWFVWRFPFPEDQWISHTPAKQPDTVAMLNYLEKQPGTQKTETLPREIAFLQESARVNKMKK